MKYHSPAFRKKKMAMLKREGSEHSAIQEGGRKGARPCGNKNCPTIFARNVSVRNPAPPGGKVPKKKITEENWGRKGEGEGRATKKEKKMTCQNKKNRDSIPVFVREYAVDYSQLWAKEWDQGLRGRG